MRSLLLSFLSIIVMGFHIDRALFQLDVEIDCAIETDALLSFEGNILLRSTQNDETSFFLSGYEGQIIDNVSALINGWSYYNPSNASALFWSGDWANSEFGENEISVHIWQADSPEYIVSDFFVPNGYRPVQWLHDNQFLFADIADDSFVVISTLAGDVQETLSTNAFPDMRAIPLVFQDDYDIAFSPDARYVAYESEAIERGIVVWDTEISAQIAEFVTDNSGLAQSHLTWSYDSQKLAFAVFVETEMQVFIFDVNSGQHTQITMFDTDLPEFGRSWSTIKSITWSPDNRYVGFTGTLENSSLHILDTETMTIRNTCISKAPKFWLPSDNHLILYGNPIQILDVENNQIYTFPYENGEVIGATFPPINDFAEQD